MRDAAQREAANNAKFSADSRTFCPQLAEAVIELVAEIDEFQKLRDAVIRYDEQRGRQPWRELADMAKALAPAAEEK